MKFTFALLAGFFTLALGTVSAQAQALGDTVTAAGVFSYQAPAGWSIKDTQMSKYKVCFDTPKNGFAANINVVIQPYPKPLADYVAFNKEQLKNVPMLQNVLIIDEKPFTTAGGLSGTRLVITDTVGKSDLEQTFYIFAGTGDTKYVVTASCLAADAQADAPIFDASAKTFAPK
jgi:hypothetical protein